MNLSWCAATGRMTVKDAKNADAARTNAGAGTTDTKITDTGTGANTGTVGAFF